MDKLLSIIIPVYNAGEYLPSCLDSLINSGLSNGEILLIDDESSDNSFEICKDYAQRFPFIRVLTQKHSGPSRSRNRGIDVTNGLYVAFLDADDQVDSDAFCRTLEYLKTSTADLWISDFHRIAANGCILDRVYQIRESKEPFQNLDYLIEFLKDGERVWNVWRYLFRRDFLNTNTLRFIEGVDCAEDLEFIIRALCCVQTPVFYHNPYYFYRVHYGDTLTRQYTVKRIRELMEMLRISVEDLRPYQTVCASLLRDKLVKEYLLNLSLLFEIPKEERKEAFLEIQKTSFLLLMAKDAKLITLSRIVRCTGIMASSSILLYMKKIKRYFRKLKIKAYEKRCR